MNVVGTTQCNPCGPDGALVKSDRAKIKKATYGCKFFVHEYLPLCVALWSDNNIVTTLSNHHAPVVLTEEEGIFRRKRDADGKREKISSAVKIPEQTKAYMSDFRQIDQRNPRTPYCFCRYEHGSQCYCSCKLGVKDDARNFFSKGASVHATKKVIVAATPKYGK